MKHTHIHYLLAIGVSCSATAAFAQEDERIVHFETRIRPLLVEKCLDCHDGTKEADSKLAITSRNALLKGGEFGAAIISGKPETSLLIQAVRWTHKELKMPPAEDDRLSNREVADLQRWIEEGAVWPGGTSPSAPSNKTIQSDDSIIETDHWSFRPRTQPTPPEVKNTEWSGTAIDRFVYAKLQEQQLTPTPPTDKRTLIRRATFDLTGLPPTPEEVDAFLADTSPQSYPRLLDRLLDSPRYGERWGRHWLDVARYADTQGDVGDFPIPSAYLYRNWVINALNADLPYDRFVQMQIAGDLLAQDVTNPQEARDLLVATGFISLSRRFGNTQFEDHYLTIEDTIDTVGRGILGITLRCARCHDHKFDPLLQTDYYGLYGFFQSTRYPTMGASNEKSPSALSPPIVDAEKQRQVEAYFATIARYSYQINNHFRPWLQPTLKEYKDVTAQLASTDLSEDDRATATARREKLLAAYKGKFRELMLYGLAWIKKQTNEMADHPPFEMVFAVSEDKPVDAHLHLRGNPRNLGDAVPRGFPRVLAPGTHLKIEGSGRKELADWLSSPDNPLTARVIVNRVWQHHFGKGIVATPSNFGVQGARPSHPQLLDFLANEFVGTDKWSLKSLHRRIMSSRAYRAASTDIAANANVDPDNKFLWHFKRHRLEAEAIRDAMLAVSGNLEFGSTGAFPFPHWKLRRFSLNNPFKATYPSNHRSVYLMTQRLFRNPFFALFDSPDRNQSTAERTSANLPTQVLYMLNSPFVEQQAVAFADRITSQTNEDSAGVELAYRLAYGRPPAEEETQILSTYLQHLNQQFRDESAAAASATANKTTANATTEDEYRRRAWSAVAKAMFTSNEFLFVD